MPKKRISPIGSSRQRASSILSSIKGLQYQRTADLENVQYEVEGLKLDNLANQGLIEIGLQTIQYGKNKAELNELKNKAERGVNAYRKMTGSQVTEHKVIKMKDVKEREDLSIWDIGKEEWFFDDGKSFSLSQVMVFDDYYHKNNFENIFDSEATQQLMSGEGERGYIDWSYENSNVSTVPLEGSKEDALNVAMLKNVDIQKRVGEFLWKTRGQGEGWAKKTEDGFLRMYNDHNTGTEGFINAKTIQELGKRFMVDGETSIMGKDSVGHTAFDYLAYLESGYDPEGLFGPATDEFTFIHPLNEDGSRDYGVLGINDRHVREIDWKNLHKGSKSFGQDVVTYQKSAVDGKPDTTSRAIGNYLDSFLPTQTEEKYGLFGRKTRMVQGENEWEDELAELAAYVPDKKKNPYDMPVLNEDFEFTTTIGQPIIDEDEQYSFLNDDEDGVYIK
mgnify:CR=1 FL=1|tara:strand:+ start:5826 stop:7166 length:1341 start_codon:yes stop_codon:yes gene_type:complete